MSLPFRSWSEIWTQHLIIVGQMRWKLRCRWGPMILFSFTWKFSLKSSGFICIPEFKKYFQASHWEMFSISSAFSFSEVINSKPGLFLVYSMQTSNASICLCLIFIPLTLALRMRPWGAAITLWIRLSLPSCGPRLEVPSSPSMLLSIYIDLCHLEKTKINKKRTELAHFLKKWLAKYRLIIKKHYRAIIPLSLWCVENAALKEWYLWRRVVL